ncbi:hypothetical protein T492DRAFT_885244 [Pavlovales sp. CCMP2436]|nr:hypothetical protein T492DRAFT_885244 [Pavlovales sp. CCMP2436]
MAPKCAAQEGGAGAKLPAAKKAAAGTLAGKLARGLEGWAAPDRPDDGNVLVRDFLVEQWRAGAHAQTSFRVAAFDFDGCLAKTRLQDNRPEAWSMQFAQVPDALRKLHAEGYPLAVH